MFNERIIDRFIRQFPDHKIVVTCEMVDGSPRYTAQMEAGDEVIASSTCPRLGDAPCALANKFREALGAIEDVDAAPSSMKTAIEEGIPGVARPRPKVPSEWKKPKGQKDTITEIIEDRPPT